MLRGPYARADACASGPNRSPHPCKTRCRARHSARIRPMSSDPAAGVGILTALAAGVVSFLSPCVLPLVPGYLSAVTGIAAADLEKADWRRVIVPSLLFVASFSVIFILLGLGATGIG